MSQIYEFTAHLTVEQKPGESKQDAADRILEHMLDADIACSLWEPEDRQRKKSPKHKTPRKRK